MFAHRLEMAIGQHKRVRRRKYLAAARRVLAKEAGDVRGRRRILGTFDPRRGERIRRLISESDEYGGSVPCSEASENRLDKRSPQREVPAHLMRIPFDGESA